MFYFTPKGNCISLSFVFANTQEIEYFTLSEIHVLRNFSKIGDLLVGTLSHENIAAIMMEKSTENSELLEYDLSLSDKRVKNPPIKTVRCRTPRSLSLTWG